jgi:Asp-tRNA(Asn)/Glu-tRNA(Gln) amidotransferase A subunit family amidase
VRLLRAQGALLAGKTVTAELATYTPGPTVNPLDVGRTPGGSSSGSAAAVCAGDVPLALATQTAGSVIRPASFCGVFGFKPSYGRYSTEGVLTTSPTLDTLGLIGDSPEILRRADAVLAGRPGVAAAPATATAARRLVLYRSSRWSEADPATRALLEEHFARWRSGFAGSAERAPDPVIEAMVECQEIIHCGEVAEQLGWLVDRYPALLSERFRAMVARGRELAGGRLEAARRDLDAARARVAGLIPAGEVWLTPAAKGPAPLLATGTGDPVFCRAWTALGVPCATLPVTEKTGTLPTGVQLLSTAGEDELLLATLACLAGAAG